MSWTHTSSSTSSTTTSTIEMPSSSRSLKQAKNTLLLVLSSMDIDSCHPLAMSLGWVQPPSQPNKLTYETSSPMFRILTILSFHIRRRTTCINCWHLPLSHQLPLPTTTLVFYSTEPICIQLHTLELDVCLECRTSQAIGVVRLTYANSLTLPASSSESSNRKQWLVTSLISTRSVC